MDKELAGWQHTRSYGQWLIVHMETSDKWHPSGANTGAIPVIYIFIYIYIKILLFNIFAGDTDSRIECSLSKFAGDTRLCGEVNRLEGRDTIQRDFDRLDRWDNANLINFNKVKCKALHLDPGNARHSYRAEK